MKIVLIFIIGIVLGLIDIAPMIKNKLDKYSIQSAFIYHLIMPFVLYSITNKLSVIITGAILYFICAIPIVILVSKDDKKSVPIILISSTILGTICGFILHLIA